MLFPAEQKSDGNGIYLGQLYSTSKRFPHTAYSVARPGYAGPPSMTAVWLCGSILVRCTNICYVYGAER